MFTYTGIFMGLLPASCAWAERVHVTSKLQRPLHAGVAHRALPAARRACADVDLVPRDARGEAWAAGHASACDARDGCGKP